MSRDIIKRCNKIFPWFSGLSADLLFFVAIDTLWLTVVKGLSASQIVSLTTISLVASIILQMPILKIISKIGNTRSVRAGVMMMLAGALLITYGNSYLVIVSGKIIFEISISFRNMDSAILKNNLSLLHLGDEEFVRIRNQASTVYSVVTAIIAFVAAWIFNYNHYLPMYLCIGACVLCLAMSFFVRDFSENSRRKHINDSKEKLNKNKFVLMAILAFALYYPLLDSGQCNGKLFIQQDMMTFYSVSKTATCLTLVVAISRVARILSNMVFSPIYVRYKGNVVRGLAWLLMVSVALLIIGFYLPYGASVKFTVMAIGYVIMLSIRDPFRTYMQNLILNNTEKSNQQAALIYMEMARKVAAAIFNITASLIMLRAELLWIMFLTLALSLVEIVICFKLHSMVVK